MLLKSVTDVAEESQIICKQNTVKANHLNTLLQRWQMVYKQIGFIKKSAETAMSLEQNVLMFCLTRLDEFINSSRRILTYVFTYSYFTKSAERIIYFKMNLQETCMLWEILK